MAFFGGMPFSVQFVLAFVVVLGLIGATAWAVRRLGTGRLGSVGLRGRQPRLAIIEYANVDGRRRLILLRRDNVEHLVMVGGPTDIVVESSIVRAMAASREPASRPAAAPPVESLPRQMPMPEGAGHNSWPLQPEPGAPAAAQWHEPPSPPAPSASPPPLPIVPPLPAAAAAPAAPSRTQRDSLAALAEELSPRPVPQRSRPSGPPRLQPVDLRQEPRQDLRQETRQEIRPEPRQESRPESRQEPRQEPRLASVQTIAPETRAPAVQPAAAEPGFDPDQNLAEMAQRLEAALRKPALKLDGRDGRATPTRVTAPAEPPPLTESAPAAAPATAAPPPPPAAIHPIASDPRPARAAEARPRADAKPANPGKTLYDSLEQEMASLLGRPMSKT